MFVRYARGLLPVLAMITISLGMALPAQGADVGCVAEVYDPRPALMDLVTDPQPLRVGEMQAVRVS